MSAAKSAAAVLAEELAHRLAVAGLGLLDEQPLALEVGVRHAGDHTREDEGECHETSTVLGPRTLRNAFGPWPW